AQAVRGRELDPGVARAHAFEHRLETEAAHATRGIGRTEMIDDDANAGGTQRRQHRRELRTFEIDFDVPVERADSCEETAIVVSGDIVQEVAAKPVEAHSDHTRGIE